MRLSVNFPIRVGLRIAAVGALALSASACSQTSDRFAYDPFSNPFNGKETTGSVGSAPVGSAPTGGVSSQPLPPPGGGYQQSSYSAAPAYAPQSARPYPPYGQQQQAAATYPAPQQSQYKYNPQSGWSASGGQTIVVKPGDTAFTLGTKHGVPATAILQANHLSPGAMLTPGQRVVIPSYKGPSSAAAQAKPVAPARMAEAPRAMRPTNGATHTVKPGDTLFSIARQYSVTATDLAATNRVGLDHRVQMGEKISIPGDGRLQPAVASARQADQPKMVQPLYQPQAEAKAEPEAPRVEARKPDPKPEPEVAAPSSGGTDFRWPVRGRVISAFGNKPNGQTNDGVNISVPEGTDIKAAEGGVVAYAGNELKGFGNLILIRHAGEWVTAYAHASDITVKRGDVVRRGQTIGKSGKSGNVSSPQLHFEVRRGASPVDPMDHLPQG